MKNKKTYYQLILDRSGSMDDCISETISGFNEQVQMIQSLQLRYPEQEFYVSLTVFNQEVSFMQELCRPDAIKELSRHSYIPNGGTALLDAIGMSVTKLHMEIQPEISEGIASAIVVIITDGYENASREYTHKQISSMISRLEESENWVFSYLGATADAVKVARRMNIRSGNSRSYHKKNTASIYSSLANSMASYAEEKQSGKVKKTFLDIEEASKISRFEE